MFNLADENPLGTFSVDDSMYEVDTPENLNGGPTALLILRYQHWLGTLESPITSQEDPVDIRGAEVTFKLASTDLDLKGGYLTFWFVTNRGQRYHYVADYLNAPEGSFSTNEIYINPAATTDWQLSWSYNPNTPYNLDLSMGSVVSYGIAAGGFSSKPTGSLSMKDFKFEILTVD